MVPSLAYRFFNRPLAVEARFAQSLVEAFSVQALVGRIAPSHPEERASFRTPYARPEASLAVAETRDAAAPYDLISGVAIVTVRGTLVHSNPSFWMDEMSYDEIGESFSAALGDASVKAIVLQVASPGGEVDGCFELADQIFAARGQKPIIAICDPYAYSAAYALASAADRITVPATGGAGSVGVVALHAEISRMLANAGVGVTVFQYGEQKAERGMFAPLTDGAKDRLQADIDAIGEMFISRVARNRGLSEDAVRATQAAALLADAAVKAGLADEIAAPQQAFASLVNSVN